MAIQHTFFGPVDLPTPEPLRRVDPVAASVAGVRIVRPARVSTNEPSVDGRSAA